MPTKYLVYFVLFVVIAPIGAVHFTPLAVQNNPMTPAAHTGTTPTPADDPSRVSVKATAPPSNHIPGYPNITTLPKKIAKVFKDTALQNNDGELHRIAVDLKTSSVVAFDLPQGTPAFSQWRVVGPVKGLLLQDEGQPAVGDLKGLIQHVTGKSKNDAEKALAIFEFVRDDVHDWWYPAMRGELTVPDLNQLIWSFGYGYCYDLSRLLAGLWDQAGLRSRIVSYTKHTVAEVFYDGSWHLFDPQHHSYYRKADGQVASFAELKANPKLFYQNLNAYGLDLIGYPPKHMTEWYAEWEPRFEDSQTQDYWEADAKFAIDLRAGEFIDINYAEPGPAYHPDSWVIYYGLKTNRKDPTNTYRGRLCYSPYTFTREKSPMPWKKVTSPNGKPGYLLEMANPFVISEGYLDIPGGAHLPQGWIVHKNQTIPLGQIAHGKIHLTQHVAGTTQFQVILQLPEGVTPEQAHLPEAYVELLLDLSHIGLPRLKPGKNQLPMRFTQGSPHFTAWFKEHAADLSVTKLTTEPLNPKPNSTTTLVFQITNSGSGTSRPTSLSVFNNVTAFLSETTQAIGTLTIPPIPPGQSTQVSLAWEASTDMTWYGKSPYVQLIDARLDIDRDQVDSNPTNQHFQQYVLLRKEDGSLPTAPYQ